MNEEKIVPLGCAALLVFSMSITIAFNLKSELGAVIFMSGILIWLFLGMKRMDQENEEWVKKKDQEKQNRQ